MIQDVDPTPRSFDLPCGGVAIFDRSSGISYRCNSCFAVVGSIGMPRDCSDLYRSQEAGSAQQASRRAAA